MGVFALYTAKLLIDFKINHPEVHNMGDAGYILFGPIGRETLSAGTIIFAICATASASFSAVSPGSQPLTGLGTTFWAASPFSAFE
jgi:hypothetical protein